jgi:putative transposase
MLAIVDDFTQERLGLVVDTSLTALRVIRELDRVAEARLFNDDGQRQRHRADLEHHPRLQQEHGVEWHYIARGADEERLRRELQRPAAR